MTTSFVSSAKYTKLIEPMKQKLARYRSLVEYVIAIREFLKSTYRSPTKAIVLSSCPLFTTNQFEILGYGSIVVISPKLSNVLFSPRIIGIRKSGPFTDDFADSLIRTDSLLSVFHSRLSSNGPLLSILIQKIPYPIPKYKL